jgi:hypothetical protein
MMGKVSKASHLKALDWALIALSVAASLWALWWAGQRPGGRPTVILEAPQGRWLYPLDTSEVVRIPGLVGESILEIRAGKVRFLDSPCENKICVAHPPLSQNGDWAACLPNQVFARIEGAPADDASPDALDATTF